MAHTAQSWSTLEQHDFLDNLFPDYSKIHSTPKPKYESFWANLKEVWFKAYPEIKSLYPDIASATDLDDDQRESLKLAVKKRIKQLKSWYRWRASKAYHTGGRQGRRRQRLAIEPIKDSSRALKVEEMYAKSALGKDKVKEYSKELMEEMMLANGGKLPPGGNLICFSKASKKMYEEEDDDVKAEILAMIEAETKFKKEEQLAEKDRTPEQYLAAIENAGEALHIQLHSLAMRTGWSFSVLMGGPNPCNAGGALSVGSYHVGKTPLGSDFGMTPNFKNVFMQPFTDFLEDVYPSSVRQERALVQSGSDERDVMDVSDEGDDDEDKDVEDVEDTPPKSGPVSVSHSGRGSRVIPHTASTSSLSPNSSSRSPLRGAAPSVVPLVKPRAAPSAVPSAVPPVDPKDGSQTYLQSNNALGSARQSAYLNKNRAQGAARMPNFLSQLNEDNLHHGDSRPLQANEFGGAGRMPNFLSQLNQGDAQVAGSVPLQANKFGISGARRMPNFLSQSNQGEIHGAASGTSQVNEVGVHAAQMSNFLSELNQGNQGSVDSGAAQYDDRFLTSFGSTHLNATYNYETSMSLNATAGNMNSIGAYSRGSGTFPDATTGNFGNSNSIDTYNYQSATSNSDHAWHGAGNVDIAYPSGTGQPVYDNVDRYPYENLGPGNQHYENQLFLLDIPLVDTPNPTSSDPGFNPSQHSGNQLFLPNIPPVGTPNPTSSDSGFNLDIAPGFRTMLGGDNHLESTSAPKKAQFSTTTHVSPASVNVQHPSSASVLHTPSSSPPPPAPNTSLAQPLEPPVNNTAVFMSTSRAPLSNAPVLHAPLSSSPPSAPNTSLTRSLGPPVNNTVVPMPTSQAPLPNASTARSPEPFVGRNVPPSDPLTDISQAENMATNLPHNAEETRRSSRAAVPSKRAELLNKIGDNTKTFVHPGPGKENVDPMEPPPWLMLAKAHLLSRPLGDEWNRCVEEWLALEAILGSGNFKGALPAVSARPDEWNRWVSKSRQGQRQYDMTPDVPDSAELGIAIVKWWHEMQPSFRKSEDKMPTPIYVAPDASMWDPLRKSGPNGLVSVMTLVVWWGQALADRTQFQDDSTAEWKNAVIDIRECINAIRTTTNVLQKRKATMGKETSAKRPRV